MRHFKTLATAVGAALLVAACGGGGDGNQSSRIAFSSMVSFGDSLSDVGTYNVGDVKTVGGGKFTVNGITVDDINNPASKNWTERIAAQLGLSAPCAAETGLAGAGFLTPTLGAIAAVFHGECFNYAQGGARVTLPIGPSNVANPGPIAAGVGELTVPVVTQIQNHLGIVGQFSGTELVTVFAGANDVLQLTDELTWAATAAGNAAFAQSLVAQFVGGAPAVNQLAALGAIGLAVQTEAANPSATATSIVTAAATAAGTHAFLNGYTNTAVANAAAIGAAAGADGAAAGAAYATLHGPDLVVAMGTAGAELAIAINTQIVAKGAKYVAVLNLPDVSLTPASRAQSVETQGLIHAMVTTFNAQLKAGLVNTAHVKVIDIYANVNDQVANPGPYGLTNVTGAACDFTKTALESVLLCTKDTLVAGDVSHYLWAEGGGHPTPFELKLIASVVARDLAVAGWL